MKLYGVLTYQTMKKLSSTTQYTKISKKHLNTTKTASFHCNTKTRASNLEQNRCRLHFFPHQMPWGLRILRNSIS